jgi:polyhydroxybutyrate depolymerase
MTKRVTVLMMIAATILSVRIFAVEIPQTMTWQVGDDTRRAIVYPPSADSRGKAPLVFSFHGHGDNMQNFRHTALHRAWPEAVVVYFQGLPSRRDGLSGWQVERGQDADRDLRLVDVALASLAKTFNVDQKRVYSTGFSNGAGFTYLLWAERPGIFAAFAPVAGRLRPSVELTQPKPVLHVGGTADMTVPFVDQVKAIETAKLVDGVRGTGESCGTGCTFYGSGAAPVMTWIHSGGHDYPASTAERIANFFREHPLTR